MTVSEILTNLLNLEINGHGDKRIYVECNSDIEETSVVCIKDIEVEKSGVYIQI